MAPAGVVAVAAGLAFIIGGCDRFAHPRYDSPGSSSYGGLPAAGSATGGGSDFSAPTCQAVTGAVNEGAACVTANDCAPTCCACNGGEWAAASCVAGRCASSDVACGRTGSCGAAGAPIAPATCGGLQVGQPACDECMRTNCCADEATCASDPTCGEKERCLSACTDDACVIDCEQSYPSRASDDLAACLASSCGAACP